MESATILRSLHCSVSTVSHLRSAIERPRMYTTWPSCKSMAFGLEVFSYQMKRPGAPISCLKTPDSVVLAKSDGSLDKNSLQSATFPNGLEALVQEVCDTQIAELKLKVGDFELHLKRNIVEASIPVAAPTAPLPAPIEPQIVTTPSAPPSHGKSASEKANPFTNVAIEKSKKLAGLEASGASGYILVSSPTVGSFRRGRTVKGKKQPPSCKEGDAIKEGQIICYLDQFGTELPVKSDAAGEVLKILFEDGEPVGYGDPLVALK